jgi:hypothetical protein
LTVLCENGWSGSGRILRIEAQVATIECAARLESGAAIRMDASDALLLGECRASEGDGSHFRAQIIVEQVIPSMSDLAKLVSAICGATPRQEITTGEQSPKSRAAGR